MLENLEGLEKQIPNNAKVLFLFNAETIDSDYLDKVDKLCVEKKTVFLGFKYPSDKDLNVILREIQVSNLGVSHLYISKEFVTDSSVDLLTQQGHTVSIF